MSEYCTNRCQRTHALLHRRPTATAPSFLCKRFPNGDGSHGARVCLTLWPRPVTPQVSSSVISAAKQHSGLAQFAALSPAMLRSPLPFFSRTFICVVPRHYSIALHASRCMPKTIILSHNPLNWHSVWSRAITQLAQPKLNHIVG